MVPYGANYRRANEIIGREERERELQYTGLSRYPPRLAPPSMINRPRNGNYNMCTNDYEAA